MPFFLTMFTFALNHFLSVKPSANTLVKQSMTQVENQYLPACLPAKCETLISNSVLQKKKKKGKET
jgi:hypothetical protein